MGTAVIRGNGFACLGPVEYVPLAKQSARKQFAADLVSEGGDVPFVKNQRRLISLEKPTT